MTLHLEITDYTVFYNTVYWTWMIPVYKDEIYEFISVEQTDDTIDMYRAVIFIEKDTLRLYDAKGYYMGLTAADEDTYDEIITIHKDMLVKLLKTDTYTIQYEPESLSVYIAKLKANATAHVNLSFSHNFDPLVKENIYKKSLPEWIDNIPLRPDNFYSLQTVYLDMLDAQNNNLKTK